MLAQRSDISQYFCDRSSKANLHVFLEMSFIHTYIHTYVKGIIVMQWYIYLNGLMAILLYV